MELTSMSNLFSLIAVVFGGYCFYAWYQLRDGRIPEKFKLLSQELSPDKCLDQEYYAAYMRPRLLIFSTVIVLSGVIGLLDTRFGFFRAILGDQGYIANLLATSIIPFAFVVWLCICLNKIQKELW